MKFKKGMRIKSLTFNRGLDNVNRQANKYYTILKDDNYVIYYTGENGTFCSSSAYDEWQIEKEQPKSEVEFLDRLKENEENYYK